jgi:hypothetical protein
MSGDVRLNCDLEVTLKSDVEWSGTNWTTTAPKYLAIVRAERIDHRSPNEREINICYCPPRNIPDDIEFPATLMSLSFNHS